MALKTGTDVFVKRFGDYIIGSNFFMRINPDGSITDLSTSLPGILTKDATMDRDGKFLFVPNSNRTSLSIYTRVGESLNLINTVTVGSSAFWFDSSLETGISVTNSNATGDKFKTYISNKTLFTESIPLVYKVTNNQIPSESIIY